MPKTMIMFAAAMALLAVGCGGDDDDTSQPAESGTGADIEIVDFDFGDPIAVAAGTEVTVTNADSTAHTWTASDGGGFDSGGLAPGDTFDFTFEEAGEFAFVCTIHPSMMGSITVTG